MTLTCGIDVGGTKIAGGVVDPAGTILEQRTVFSPAADRGAIEHTIGELVTAFRSRHEVTAVGVGAAGYVDKRRATVLFAANLAWRGVPLKADLERRIGLPVIVENDANAAAWGEFAFGAGADVDDLALVTVGTGIGGGIVLDGELYRGAFGIAAEIGHMRVIPGGRLCGCGNRGCWEQYASGRALVRNTQEALAADPTRSRLATDVDGDLDGITGPMITAAAKAGEEFAIEQLAELGRWVGEGAASLAAVLDPAVIVIGGGVGAAGDLLMTPVRAAFERELAGRAHRPMPEIRPAALGNDAGLIGAADLARR